MSSFCYDWKLPDRITHATLDMNEVVGGTLVRKTGLHLIPIQSSTWSVENS